MNDAATKAMAALEALNNNKLPTNKTKEVDSLDQFMKTQSNLARKEIDVGIILTFDEMAYQRWKGEAKSYKTARASLQKVTNFLQGDYSSVVTVPLWCIGIE